MAIGISIVMTAPMVDYKIHWLKMMSVPESQAVVGRHDGINRRDRSLVRLKAGACAMPDKPIRDLPPPPPNKPEENPFDRPLDDPDKRPPGIPPGIPIPDLPTPPPTEPPEPVIEPPPAA